MSNEFAIAEVMPGKLNALVKNLMCQMDITDPNEAVRRINSGEWVVSQVARHWREQDGVIYFSVTSDGTTGPQWIARLEKKGSRLSRRAKDVLNSQDFKPTAGVITEIAALKRVLFEDNDRITKKIRAAAYAGTFTKGRKLFDPHAEVACLIRESFSDEEIEAMGLWWIVSMHESIKDFDGGPSLLGIGRGGIGRWLSTCCGGPDVQWDRRGGFAFALSQISPQS